MKPSLSHCQEEEGLPALHREEWTEMLVESKASIVFKSSQTLIAVNKLSMYQYLKFEFLEGDFPSSIYVHVHIYW